MEELYIGIMSGTSANAVDVALVDFTHQYPVLIGTHHRVIPDALRQKIQQLAIPSHNEINRLAEIDISIAKISAKLVNELLYKNNFQAKDIQAIGSHGQTVRHQPHGKHRFSLQVGDPNIITTMTGITTITDFRRRDIALGGQGAPLTPIFHQHFFGGNTRTRAIVNIGGIANATILSSTEPGELTGFDTGPGNTLIDKWINLHKQTAIDIDGRWARTGCIHQALLANMLTDPYFSKSLPKSTGQEYFNLTWLNQYLAQFPTINPADVQATLVELTVKSIALILSQFIHDGEVVICGGGAYNQYLMQQLKASCPSFSITSSQKYGIEPEWVEAIAFAWLAKLTLQRKPGNMPSVTGAQDYAILGGIYTA